jgi:hypothetical protein
MNVTVGNKKMASTCTSNRAQLEYNSNKLLRNLLAAILFPKSLDLALLSLHIALPNEEQERPLLCDWKNSDAGQKSTFW